MEGHLIALAAGRALFLCLTPAAGPFNASASALAAVHVLSLKRCRDHGPCAPHPAPDLDRLDRTVQCTGPALHAVRGVPEHRLPWSLGKDTMRADLGAPTAVDAPLGIISERILGVRIKHQITPIRRLTPRSTPKNTPATAMTAMGFTYRNISFFTPVLDV